MCRLILGLCALNMGAFPDFILHPQLASETRVTSAGRDAVQSVTDSAMLDCKTTLSGPSTSPALFNAYDCCALSRKIFRLCLFSLFWMRACSRAPT